jgi:hypothetical protein
MYWFFLGLTVLLADVFWFSVGRAALLLLLSLLGVPIGSVVVLSSYAVLAGLSVVDGDVLLQPNIIFETIVQQDSYRGLCNA